MAVIINKLITGSMGVGSGDSTLASHSDTRVTYVSGHDPASWSGEIEGTIQGSGRAPNFKPTTQIPDVTNIIEIDFGNTVTVLGKTAFIKCDKLTNIIIPSSVTNIGSMTFSGCSSLTSVTIPDSVTSISSSAFYNCSGLTNVTIGDNVTSIEGNAFQYCYGLTSMTIPDSVTSIGGFAFYGCSGLTSVTFEGKDKATVQVMTNFPFGLKFANENGVTIHCTDGDIEVSYEGE